MRGMNAGDDIIEDSTPEKIAKNHAKAKTCNAIRMNYLDMHGKTAKVFGYEGLEQQKQQEQQKQAQDNKEKNKEVVEENGDKDRYPLINDNGGELLKDIQGVKPNDFGEPVNEQDQVVRNNELNVK